MDKKSKITILVTIIICVAIVALALNVTGNLGDYSIIKHTQDLDHITVDVPYNVNFHRGSSLPGVTEGEGQYIYESDDVGISSITISTKVSPSKAVKSFKSLGYYTLERNNDDIILAHTDDLFTFYVIIYKENGATISLAGLDLDIMKEVKNNLVIKDNL